MPSIDIVIEANPIVISFVPTQAQTLEVKFGAVDSVNGSTGAVTLGGSASTPNTKYQLRRDTSTNWTSTNPTLLSGEQGLETDTGLKKTGNGTTAWNSLAYDSAVVQTTGTALTFVRDTNYGTVASPETGNITASTAGARLGVTNIIVHNHSVEPTFDSKFKKLSGSSDYTISVTNYIMCQYVDATHIVYSIQQEA
jgi:hypothetical protein